eukprot:7674746-Alexandrium_andersonii.AAC.1
MGRAGGHAAHDALAPGCLCRAAHVNQAPPPSARRRDGTHARGCGLSSLKTLGFRRLKGPPARAKHHAQS